MTKLKLSEQVTIKGQSTWYQHQNPVFLHVTDVSLLNKLCYLGGEDLPGKVTIEDQSVYLEKLETKTGEITYNANHVPVSELVSICQIGSE